MVLPVPVFDSHLHLIDPRFPLVANRGFTPDPFRIADYWRALRALGLDPGDPDPADPNGGDLGRGAVVGGAVVSGSFQAFDQTYLVAALETLGPRFVGVTQLPPEVSDTEILRLHGAGVRALRLNL